MFSRIFWPHPALLTLLLRSRRQACIGQNVSRNFRGSAYRHPVSHLASYHDLTRLRQPRSKMAQTPIMQTKCTRPGARIPPQYMHPGRHTLAALTRVFPVTRRSDRLPPSKRCQHWRVGPNPSKCTVTKTCRTISKLVRANHFPQGVH